jgi:broad specificity phosphatase PhoE
MSKLILIKHAAPEVVPGISPEKWVLSERGRQSCAALAERLRTHQPGVIVSSTEPKAIETARLVSVELKAPHEAAADLHEHDRSNVPHLRSGEFISMVELFFRRPDELVLGKETAQRAEQRFAAAVQTIIKTHAKVDTIGIVSHGTVIALFLARYATRPPFQIWREMGLPSFVVLDRSTNQVVETVNKLDE